MNLSIGRFMHCASCLWLAAILVAASHVVWIIVSMNQKAFAQAGRQEKPAQPTAEQRAWQEYEKSFELRWRDLLQHPEKNAKSKWALLENDLHVNAKKYNQRLEVAASKPMTGATAVVNSTFTVPCLSQYDRPGYRCFIFPERNGECRYICAPVTK
jgi:hypothetical protein